jgi:hypothetical protein
MNNQSTEMLLQRAKELIQSRRYNDAQALLITIDHPTAKQWLARLKDMSIVSSRPDPAKLQAINDQIESRQSQKNAATIVFIFCLLLSPIGIGIVLMPFALFNYFRHKNKLNELKKQRIQLLNK